MKLLQFLLEPVNGEMQPLLASMTAIRQCFSEIQLREVEESKDIDIRLRHFAKKKRKALRDLELPIESYLKKIIYEAAEFGLGFESANLIHKLKQTSTPDLVIAMSKFNIPGATELMAEEFKLRLSLV